MPRGPIPAYRRISAGGYVALLEPDHPDAWKNGRILEHRLVMEKHLKRRLGRNEHVHHRDRDRQNNAIANLELISPAEHTSLHKRQESRQQKIWEIPLGTLRNLYQKIGSEGIAEKYKIPQPSVMNVLRTRGLYFVSTCHPSIEEFRSLPVEKLRDLYSMQGMASIGRDFGVSYKVVRNLLLAHGIPLRDQSAMNRPRHKSGFRKLPIGRLRTLYAKRTVPELATMFQIAKSTVYLTLKEHQLLIDRRRRRMPAAQKPTACRG